MPISEETRIGLLQVMQITTQAIDDLGGDAYRDEEYSSVRLGLAAISRLATHITDDLQDKE